MAQFEVGDRVIWRHEPRGGYGYCVPVNGTVEQVGPTRIRIQVEKRDGSRVSRWVTPDRLQQVAP